MITCTVSPYPSYGRNEGTHATLGLDVFYEEAAMVKHFYVDESSTSELVHCS